MSLIVMQIEGTEGEILTGLELHKILRLIAKE
jgi:hypothetical protein